MNLQAHLQVQSKNGDKQWGTYCREPVSSVSQAEGMAQYLANRLREPTRINMQNWDDLADAATNFVSREFKPT